MSKILAGFALVAATYVAFAYNVEIKVSEKASYAACDPKVDPNCN